MIVRFSILLWLACVLVRPAEADGRHVVFVDNTRSEAGIGTFDHPFRRLAAAQSSSGAGDIIYVAEGILPYEDGIALKRGQALVGAAYGLENLRVDLKVDLDGPVVAAVQGPGPTIHGTISATGDNVVAGCTIATERMVGLVAPQLAGPLAIRQVWFRPSKDAFAVSISEANFPVTITGGGVIAQSGGNGIAISGGVAAVNLDHFPMSGDVGTAVFVGNRVGGVVKFAAGSSIKVTATARDAIVVTNSKGSVVFEDPIQIVVQGGRGLFITGSDKVVLSAGSSRIASTDAAAVDIKDSGVDIVLENVSADGRLVEGIAINKLRGRFSITGDTVAGHGSGGTIRNAQQYGVRIEQTSGVRIAHMNVLDTAGIGKLKCPEDLGADAGVVCRAGVFLRHVSNSAFEDIRIDRAGQVGLNANNIRDVTFSDLDVLHSGETPSHAAVLLEEMSGPVELHRCSIVDGGGGAVAIEQRFNQGRIVFDRVTLAAPERPVAALLRARTTGSSLLQLDLNNLELRDNTGSGVQVNVTDTSTLFLNVPDARVQRLGGPMLQLSASDSSHTAVSIREGYVVGVRDSIVAIDLAQSSEACVDVAGNHFEQASANPVRLSVRSPNARVRVVSGSQATIDSPAGAVTQVPSCR
jgi:hypothetical protein